MSNKSVLLDGKCSGLKTSLQLTLMAMLLVSVTPSYATRTPRGIVVVDIDLNSARHLYSATTTLKRRDCDPVSDGRWICASYSNPKVSDFITGEDGPYSGKPIAVLGATLRQAKDLYRLSTVLNRADCDPHGTQWICASFNNPDVRDVAGLTAQKYNEEPTYQQDSGEQVGGQPSRSPSLDDLLRLNNLPNGSLYAYGDLLSMNYDSCPDPDDLHAAVAGKMVLDFYQLDFGVDYIVNNGTCGDSRPRSDYIQNSQILFDQLYSIRWNDVFHDEAYSIATTAERYQKTLNSGGKVWVLDGGPMDFTARVIRYLKSLGTSASLKNITVIQHSHGWNENNTTPVNVEYIRNNVRYLKIDSGNHKNNKTAQLNQSNVQSAFPAVDNKLVKRFLLNDVYSDAWQVAFSLFGTDHRFDGSDTVELLWVLGLDSSRIADWYDFADKFLPDTDVFVSGSTDKNSGDDNDRGKDNPITTSTPANPNAKNPANFNAKIRLEAESVPLSEGWVRETARSGFSGRGYIRWNGNNNYARAGTGVLKYSFVPTVTGIHVLYLRARAINPPKSDLNNDVWVRMDGIQAVGSSDFTNWVKVFTTGQDNWQTGGTVDILHSKQSYRQRLTAGQTYTVELSARSENYAIDFLEIVAE